MKPIHLAIVVSVGCTTYGGSSSFDNQAPTPATLEPPVFGGTSIMADHALPPPSGGTIGVVSRHGVTYAIASIPEADRIAVVFVATSADTPFREIALERGAEPGRVVGDPDGRAHVVLRGTGEVLTFDPETGAILFRRKACSAPRGIAYDHAIDALHVACTTGELVTLPASDGPAFRRVFLDTDLRDVVVLPDDPSTRELARTPSRMLVSRFRSAEILTVAADGSIRQRTSAPPSPKGTRTAHVAWRMVEAPMREDLSYMAFGVQLAYQLEQVAPIPIAFANKQAPTPHGYNGEGDPRSAIEAGEGAPVVQAAMARWGDGIVSQPFAIDGATPAMDIAVAHDGTVAVAAGDRVAISGTFSQHFVMGTFRQVTSVAFAYDGSEEYLIAQWRGSIHNAGVISKYVRRGSSFAPVTNVGISGMDDTGLDVFVTPAIPGKSSIACASCHPEGGDDGHVWSFQIADEMRARRTQSLRGGILSTAPFHWDGDMLGMQNIAAEVFTRRMGGGSVTGSQRVLLERFIDAIPRLPARADLDPAAVERGLALFEGAGKCNDCHTGSKHTNNATLDIGKEVALQVPQLVNLGYRAPYMHDGCARTLLDRFDPACGGDKHGAQDLTDAQKADLVAYLQSL